jgi:glucose/arabinose dehydrogenase
MPSTLFSGGLAAALSLVGAATAQISTQTVAFRNYFAPATGAAFTAPRFNRPLQVTRYPGEDSAFVVLEQVGRISTIRWVDNAWRRTDSAAIAVPVLSNINEIRCTAPKTRASGTLTTGTYESRGLLGFAFHPRFRGNGKYYVSYISVEDGEEVTVVSERQADSTRRPRTGDAERRLFSFCQTYWDHKGGQIHFGPDGYLYYASGDGGPQEYGNASGAYLNNNPAQIKNGWLGKMIRIHVDTTENGKAYGIPPDNPFKDSSAYLPEIYALGFRNPWKFTFHPVTGKLWLGDVGYVTREEISIVPKGGNMGWKAWEGDHCNLTTLCDPGRYVKPVHSLVHNQDGRSVTGGNFYFGDSLEPFRNTYIFGDYIFRTIWAARVSGDSLKDVTPIGDVQNVVSFDRDSSGRILVTSLGVGGVTPNSGVVYVAEFPSRPDPVIAGVRGRITPAGGARITKADVLRNPEGYEIRTLDGRRIRGGIPAVFRVREKGGRAPQRLMTQLE